MILWVLVLGEFFVFSKLNLFQDFQVVSVIYSFERAPVFWLAFSMFSYFFISKSFWQRPIFFMIFITNTNCSVASKLTFVCVRTIGICASISFSIPISLKTALKDFYKETVLQLIAKNKISSSSQIWLKSTLSIYNKMI